MLHLVLVWYLDCCSDPKQGW